MAAPADQPFDYSTITTPAAPVEPPPAPKPEPRPQRQRPKVADLPRTAPVPPHNLDAEESVLGAMMLSPRTIDAVHEHVDASDFYRESHATIYRAARALHAKGEPVDAITLADELEERGELKDIGGKPRIHELAALVPATANAPHYARLVREAATLRDLIRAGGDIARLGWERPLDTPDLLDRAAEITAAVAGRRNGHHHERFAGLTHGEALTTDAPDDPELVADLIDAGAPGTIAALPESYKSWAALELAHKIAAGGKVFDRFEVLRTGPVGYWFQDDGRGKALDRVKTYSARHQVNGDTPIRWHLGEGLQLPADLPALRHEVEQEGQVFVVLDSLYNFVGGLALKEEEAAGVLARIKAEVCDPTGAAVCIIDHAPWPTEGNRGQRRAYGSVFKAAAIRWGIYLERTNDHIYIEARGNNVTGLRRTPCYFDKDRLELRLIEHPTAEEHAETVNERAETVLAWLTDNPGRHSTNAVRKAVQGRAKVTDQALEQLKARDEVHDSSRNGGTWSGRGGDPRYWQATNQAKNTSSLLDGTRWDEVGSGSTAEGTSSHPPPNPVGVGRGPRDEVPPASPPDLDDAEVERLADLARHDQEGGA